MRVVNGRRQTVIGVSRIFRNLRTSHLKTPLLKVLGGGGGGDIQLITSELKPLTKAFKNMCVCIYIYTYIYIYIYTARSAHATCAKRAERQVVIRTNWLR